MASFTQKPSSSTSIHKHNFEVFLSFRGEDTRNNFTDHLFVNLNQMGIHTFRDDQLERGEEIKLELLKTIEESRISIVVFSKNYAYSKWCLDELAKIMECKEEVKQIVLPVFYHVDPSDVRKQTGSFGEAFSIHERNVDEEKVQRWRAAMTEASNLSGCHVHDGYESEYIKKITDVILKRLDPKLLCVDDDIIGMDFRLKELKSLINSHLHDVRVVGIYGIGGIGKTTIAKIVYNKIQCEFNGASFLANVKESFKSGCQLQLQQELLHGIVGQKIKLSNINEGSNIIKDRLRSKKVLIVIDDVDHLDQLGSLVGSRKWFGEGSRIVVTTRDQHLLDNYVVDIKYEVKKLQFEEAIQLFSMHAFKQNVPKDDYVSLSQSMVNYAQGLPLALKVLGASLHGMTIDEWKSASDKLKRSLMKEINDVLRISFDGLDDDAKKVFLDFACFFKGEDKDFVLRILDSCNFSGSYNIRVLCNKCLITISDNKVQMHDLIQQMGWAIVREECLEDPCKWSRLWDPNDIYDAFFGQRGMKKIETISLDLSKLKEIQFTSEVFAEMKRVFSKMKKLRLLKVYYSDHNNLMKKKDKTCLSKDFEFPSNLRYLHWEGLESLPLNFHGENLAAINLKRSNIKKLWKGKKCLEKLKFLDLSYSQQLIKLPKFSSMPNLERLNLEGCTSFHKFHSSICAFPEMKFFKELHLCGTAIKELPSSIGSLTSLEVLDLSQCFEFEKLPDIFWNMGHFRALDLKWSKIKELPSSIGYLESLESLSVSYCSSFEKFPEIQGNMKCLKNLDLAYTAIKELPNGIGSLEALHTLSVGGCSNLEKFPEIQRNMRSLRKISLWGTAIKELPSSIGHLTGIQDLNLENCKNLSGLPSSIYGFKDLRSISLNGCSNVKAFLEIMVDMEHFHSLSLSGMAITELPSSIERLKFLKLLELNNCENLMSLPNSIGNLTCLHTLCVHNCSKLHKLPDNLRSLQCCLRVLDISGCNMMEGAIPSDLWCLFSLESLDVSENHIRCIPDGIIQLSKLRKLCMNHCLMLEEIPELPSSLRVIQAGGCPCLKTLSSDPTDELWSSLLNCFKLETERLRCNGYNGYGINVIIPGSSGIPEWISHQSMGDEVRIELPMNWYKDTNFLGFALFFHHVPQWDNKYDYYPRVDRNRHYHYGYFELGISHGDQFELVNWLQMPHACRGYYGIFSDPALMVSFFPQIGISSEYRSRRWNNFKARFKGSFHSGHNGGFKVKSCGINLIYAHAQNLHKKKDQYKISQ